MSGQLLKGSERMYINILACVKVKWDESECFRIDSDGRQGYIMSKWLFNVLMNTVMKEVKMGMGRMVVRFLLEQRE